MRPKVIIDTNVYLDALRRGGLFDHVVDIAFTHFKPVHSDETVLELREFFTSPGVRRLLGEPAINNLNGRITRKSLRIQDIKRLEQWRADPSDTMFMELAVSSGAEHFITSDGRLIKEGCFAAPGHKPVKIWSPTDFLKYKSERSIAHWQKSLRQQGHLVN